MQIDPEATLRCWPIDVDVGGHTYTIPPLPARDWLVATRGSWPDVWAGIIPGMLPDDADDLEEAIAAGRVDHDECVAAARLALEAASGTRWWTAVKLAQAVTGSWVAAELTMRGVDTSAVPFAAYLNAAWRVATRHSKEVAAAQLEAELDAPPQGLAPAEWFGDDSANLSTFGAAMAQTAGRNRGR